MAELPSLGTTMYLVHAEDTNYRSRLEAVEDQVLSVAAPLETAGTEAPRPGQEIEVFWAQPRTRIILPCQLVEITDSAPFQWRLMPTGEPQPGNRREFVRGGGGPEVQVGVEPEKVLGGRLLDISEGGLRCRLPLKPRIDVGDPMSAWLQLNDADVEVTGTVYRLREAFRGSGWEMVVIFRPDEKTAQLIRQYVYAWEIAERRRNADDAEDDF